MLRQAHDKENPSSTYPGPGAERFLSLSCIAANNLCSRREGKKLSMQTHATWRQGGTSRDECVAWQLVRQLSNRNSHGNWQLRYVGWQGDHSMRYTMSHGRTCGSSKVVGIWVGSQRATHAVRPTAPKSDIDCEHHAIDIPYEDIQSLHSCQQPRSSVWVLAKLFGTWTGSEWDWAAHAVRPINQSLHERPTAGKK